MNHDPEGSNKKYKDVSTTPDSYRDDMTENKLIGQRKQHINSKAG